MPLLWENLLRLRKETGLTQSEVADKIGIAMRSYCRYEQGEREPTASTLIKFANYYGVTIDYLVGRTDQRN